jgi:hypothetical protein
VAAIAAPGWLLPLPPPLPVPPLLVRPPALLPLLPVPAAELIPADGWVFSTALNTPNAWT